MWQSIIEYFLHYMYQFIAFRILGCLLNFVEKSILKIYIYIYKITFNIQISKKH